jgi:hypothetical protein
MLNPYQDVVWTVTHDGNRTNSQQSVRIRCLETETSRLLAENLSLREQVLQLQNNLEAQSKRPSFADVDAVKSRLEAKLLEFGGLVAELAQIQKVDSGPRCKSQNTATRRSPEERQWRGGLGLQEVENAMLPTITEGKFFPRRTIKYVLNPIRSDATMFGSLANTQKCG